MRKLMRRSDARPEFASAKAVCASTAHCTVNGTSELRKDAIARRVCYATPMLRNDPVEDRAPFGQPLERADLIRTHEAAVALDIRCEDRD